MDWRAVHAEHDDGDARAGIALLLSGSAALHVCEREWERARERQHYILQFRVNRAIGKSGVAEKLTFVENISVDF